MEAQKKDIVGLDKMGASHVVDGKIPIEAADQCLAVSLSLLQCL